MTPWDFRRISRKGAEKMGNTRQRCNLGHPHRSKLETAVCQMIQLREKAGELKLVQAEKHLYLTKARIKYIADFECVDLKTGETFFVEAKGFANQRWPIIKKLWKDFGHGRLEIWQGTYKRPVLTETITPNL